jgi:hypothetical protein
LGHAYHRCTRVAVSFFTLLIPFIFTYKKYFCIVNVNVVPLFLMYIAVCKHYSWFLLVLEY